MRVLGADQPEMWLFPFPKFKLFRTFSSLIVFYFCLLLFVSLLSPFVLLFTALLMLLLALLMHLSVLFIIFHRWLIPYLLTHPHFPICSIVPSLCHSFHCFVIALHCLFLNDSAFFLCFSIYPFSYAQLTQHYCSSTTHSALLDSSRCLVFMYIRALFLHCRSAIQHRFSYFLSFCYAHISSLSSSQVKVYTALLDWMSATLVVKPILFAVMSLTTHIVG